MAIGQQTSSVAWILAHNGQRVTCTLTRTHDDVYMLRLMCNGQVMVDRRCEGMQDALRRSLDAFGELTDAVGH
jgi:hypothetical protein